jgi:hypothetical protein
MLCRKRREGCTKGKVMRIQNQEVEKSCTVMGELDGPKFAERIDTLIVNLGKIEKLVSDLADNNDVGEKPMVSLGVEVDTADRAPRHMSVRRSFSVDRSAGHGGSGSLEPRSRRQPAPFCKTFLLPN